MHTRRTFLVAALAGCALPRGHRSRTLQSRIGQGAYTLGDDPSRRAEELATIRLGLDLGLTSIDTAEMYGDGRSESLIGEAIAGRRERVFVCTKIRPDRASYDGTLRAADESLARLRTGYIDLYLLHHPPTTFALDETMRAFSTLVARGRVRAVGVSNFETTSALGDAQRALGRTRLSCNQVKYSLRTRRLERTLAPYCRAHGIALTGYSPFDGFPTDSELLARIAAAHGVSAHAVVLAFLARDGVFQIPRAATAAFVRDNATALELRLSPAECDELARAFPA